MKRLMMAVAMTLMVAGNSHAGLRVLGSGSTLRFDPSGFPPDMQAKYEIMRAKCVKCHTLERTVIAITTGISPISGQPFDHDAIKAYGVKMMRKPGSGMSRQQVVETVELMNYLLSSASK